MSRTSEYTLELQIQDDKSKDALRELEKGLKSVGETVKRDASGDDLTKNLEVSQAAAQSMIERFHEMARDSELDFQAIAKTYSKNAGKVIAELEKQYASVKDQLDGVQKEYDENAEAIKNYNKQLENKGLKLREQAEISRKIKALEEAQKALKYDELQAQVTQNRQIRANLKAAEQSARLERANAKYKKLEELQAKRKAATDKAEKKDLAEKIKQQKAYIKAIEQAEKITRKATEQTGRLGKAWESVLKNADRLSKVTQFAYNATGMVGGAARTAIGAGKAAFGIVSGAISGVSAVADREVEKERLANRVKGFNLDDAKDMMGQLYIQTGADYAVIVEAINRVQNVLKSNDKGELVAATATEIRYPGAAQTFASANTQADAANFARYGNRLKAVQNATGASDEQVQAASELINNLKPESFKNASLTDLQTVYLGLQNSGAFDSQDELDKAFKKFVADQSKSGQNAFEFAQNYDWNKTITGERNRIQASNTLAKIDWGTMGSALSKTDEQTSQGQSSAETMAMKMRQMEEKKNELMLKLVPAVLPIVEKLSDLISGPTGSQIIDGFVNLFKAVIPALDPIFKLLEPVLKVMSRVMNWLGDVIIPKLLSVLQSIADWFGSDDSDEYAMPQNAAGGLAFMPSIVGERGPEAIIPLDYSRAQRAENIANTVNQTFNMGNSQTTALSLAQAVRSRDFTRAMTDNQFFTRRCGAF
ncbi:MAG: hypothetical protein J6S69_05180 [Proteobacteria bacterium]|nr:hypothetical protein [Pseudomonadota bacterium]